MEDGGRITGDVESGLDEARLAEFIRRELPEADEISLSEVTAASGGGVSRDHFLFDLEWSQGSTRHQWPLVLIRDGDRPAQTDRGAEFHLLRALEQTPIPAPKAHWCDTTGQWLERPFLVMERVGGAVTPPFQIPYADDPALREKLTNRFIDILCDLHGIDWKARGIDFLETADCATGDFAAAAARMFQAMIKALGVVEPQPVFERGMAWCIDHAPRTQRWTICHGDYKPDNILHADGQILAVIDWERARIGDPMADLGYVCAPHLCVGNLVSGLAEQDDIVRRYEDRFGLAVDPAAIKFWQVHLLLQTYFYFNLLTAEAARRGNAVGPEVKPLMDYMLKLIEEALG
jgi:aminoglycoside phosphotransferase (APT) family kinase protein